MTHPRVDSLRVGEHPLVKALSYMESLGNNDLLTLKILSLKLGLLFALTSVEQVSEIVDGVVFDLPELTKKSRFHQGPKGLFSCKLS